MMDLYCPRCGEPWDNDCIHEEVEERNDDSTYYTVLREFQQNGCVAFREAYGQGQCERTNSLRAGAAEAMYDLLGDDADGAAAMLEDYFG
jgi:hypothetical protein